MGSGKEKKNLKLLMLFVEAKSFVPTILKTYKIILYWTSAILI